jgi:two-component system, LytTR family, response regulator
MKNIKAILVDDEISNLTILSSMLQKYCPQVDIVCMCEGADDAYSKINTNKIDLLFLDVMMPQKTGFDLLRMFKEINFEIIFVSGFDQYALNAFEFSAIDYILKPIDFSKLQAAVERTSARIEQKLSNHLIQFVATLDEKEQLVSKIPIYQSDKVMFIETKDVAYIVAESGGYCEVFTTNNRKYVVTKSLLSFENLLQNDNRFVRASKSIIINITDVRSYDRGGTGYIEMKTNALEVFVSRRKKKEIVDAIS